MTAPSTPQPRPPVRVTHVITGLGAGGAEMMLLRLLERTDRARFEPDVVSLIGDGPVADKIRALGVPVASLGMRRGVPDPASILRLARRFRRDRPRVVQTWLYHGDLIGGLAARLAGIRAVAWNVQNSDLEPGRAKATTILTARMCARVSRSVPRRIICVSERGRDIHVALGYDPARFVLIPNGCDIQQFKPDPQARKAVRRELGIPGDAPLVGMLARWDPMKDHENFVAASAILSAHRPNAHFLLCGSGVTADNAELSALLAASGVAGRTRVLGLRDDTPRILAALDVATLSSRYGEAFSLAIGEAMSCGVPCVVTDVGDGGVLVGDTGRVVPVADAEALADGWREILALPPDARRALGLAARRRIADNYEIGSVVERYMELHAYLAGLTSPAGPPGAPGARPGAAG